MIAGPRRGRRFRLCWRTCSCTTRLIAWMHETQQGVGFERYCDDVIVHCHSEKQAKYIRNVIAARLWRFGLRFTRRRRRSCTARRRGDPATPNARRRVHLPGIHVPAPLRAHRDGRWKIGFLPAVSKQACKAMAARPSVGGGWVGVPICPSRRSPRWINRVVAGWINYYGRFYKSLLIAFLDRQINRHLVSWACRKYKHLHRSQAKARRQLAQIANSLSRHCSCTGDTVRSLRLTVGAV